MIDEYITWIGICQSVKHCICYMMMIKAQPLFYMNAPPREEARRGESERPNDNNYWKGGR